MAESEVREMAHDTSCDNGTPAEQAADTVLRDDTHNAADQEQAADAEGEGEAESPDQTVVTVDPERPAKAQVNNWTPESSAVLKPGSTWVREIVYGGHSLIHPPHEWICGHVRVCACAVVCAAEALGGQPLHAVVGVGVHCGGPVRSGVRHVTRERKGQTDTEMTAAVGPCLHLHACFVCLGCVCRSSFPRLSSAKWYVHSCPEEAMDDAHLASLLSTCCAAVPPVRHAQDVPVCRHIQFNHTGKRAHSHTEKTGPPPT